MWPPFFCSYIGLHVLNHCSLKKCIKSMKLRKLIIILSFLITIIVFTSVSFKKEKKLVSIYYRYVIISFKQLNFSS